MATRSCKKEKKPAKTQPKWVPERSTAPLDRLLKADLVKEHSRKGKPMPEDERRIFYRITATGEAALVGETERLRQVLAHARKKGVHRFASRRAGERA